MILPEIKDIEKKKKFLRELIDSFKVNLSLDKTALITLTESGILPDTQGEELELRLNIHEFLENETAILQKFELIYANLPFGLRDPNSSITEFKNNLEFVAIQKILKCLTNKGIGLFLVIPSFWISKVGKSFISQMETQGYYINAVFEMPESCFDFTSLRPYLILFSKTKSDLLFIVELTLDSNNEKIVDNMQKDLSTNLFEGIFVKAINFKSFPGYKVSKEFSSLAKQYENFRKVKMSDLIVNTKTSNFIEDNKSIYLRLAGNFKSIRFSEITKNKYLQITLDTEKVNPEYLHFFLNTDIGHKFLNAFASGTTIPFLSYKDLMKAELYLLPIDLQQKTMSIISKIRFITSRLSDFEFQVVTDPNKSETVSEELNGLYNSLEVLTKEQALLSMIRNGENKHVELKSSLRWDMKEQKINKELEKVILKTVCGFLNSDGGVLFVGVTDDGEICGIDSHLFSNVDKYLLHFKNLVKDQIGAEYYPLLDYGIQKLLKKNVLVARCKKSTNPVYLGSEELFYVRTNPSTDELKGKELVEYVKSHFSA